MCWADRVVDPWAYLYDIGARGGSQLQLTKVDKGKRRSMRPLHPWNQTWPKNGETAQITIEGSEAWLPADVRCSGKQIKVLRVFSCA